MLGFISNLTAFISSYTAILHRSKAELNCVKTRLFCNYFATLAQKKKPTTFVSDWLSFAPENIEILNLWRDFLKVVDFIDDNHEWLNPLLAQTDKMKQ